MNIRVFGEQRELASLVRLCERITYGNNCRCCALSALCDVARENSTDAIVGIEDVVQFTIDDGACDGG